jgi:hypothetical protein
MTEQSYFRISNCFLLKYGDQTFKAFSYLSSGHFSFLNCCYKLFSLFFQSSEI